MSLISQAAKRTLCFIESHLSAGQTKFGTYVSPSVLSGKFPKVSSYNVQEIRHEPHFPPDQDTTAQRRDWVFHANSHIYKANHNLRDKYKTLINLGGDHSISMGTVTANLDRYGKDLQLVWIDAHPDLNNLKSSKTGNLHGMPVNFLMSKGDELPQWLRNNKIDPNQILYIGLRDMNDYEKETLLKHHIRVITMDMIDNEDLFKLLGKYDDKKLKPIHLSIDVSALDAAIMPGTANPVPNGLMPGDVVDIVKYFQDRIKTIDFTELNFLDIEDKSDAEISVDVSQSILHDILQMYDQDVSPPEPDPTPWLLKSHHSKNI